VATTQVKKIVVRVDAPGVKEALNSIAQSTGAMNKNIKSLSTNVSFLSGAFRTWISYLGVRQMANMSDEFQNLYNRLKLTTGGVEGANTALNGLIGLAGRTNQSLSDVSGVFNRFSVALKDTGANTNQLLALTETLVNSFRVSGASADETRNAMIQLSQAFSTGVLRGQDLRSVISQNAVVARLLKQEYGGDLFKKAEAGAISTAEVFRILAKRQKEINDGAKTLTPTFEQGLTKASNALTLAFGKLNEQYQLSALFSTAVGVGADNLGTIFKTLLPIITVLALSRIPALIEGFKNLYIAIRAFTVANPLIAALTLLAGIATVVWENWDKVYKLFLKMRISFIEFAADLEENGLKIRKALLGSSASPEIQRQLKLTQDNIEALRQRAADLKVDIAESVEAPKKSTAILDMQKELNALANLQSKVKGPTKDLKDILGELNKSYDDGKISLEEYTEKLDAFNLSKQKREFREGAFDVFKYHEQLNKLKVQDLQKELNRGTISQAAFNREVSNSKIALLNEQFVEGRIAVAEYHKEINKLAEDLQPGSAFYQGASDFVESVGTLAQGVARVVTQAFEHLSDTLVDFIETGKFNFANFTKAVLHDINVMLVRAAIVAPIARGIMGLIGTGGGAPAPNFSGGNLEPTGTFFAANGGVVGPSGPMPLHKYATGGVANSPQMAIFGEGRTPEAYVPLPDGRNIPVKMEGGGGGVTVVQNINISSDGVVSSSGKSQSQTGKQLADMIKQVTIDTILQQQRPGGVLA
jgi:lambda family phage tail tape measure protein